MRQGRSWQDRARWISGSSSYGHGGETDCRNRRRPATDDQTVQTRNGRVQAVAGGAAFFVPGQLHLALSSRPPPPHTPDSSKPAAFRGSGNRRNIKSLIRRTGFGIDLASARWWVGAGRSGQRNVDGNRACFDLLDRSPARQVLNCLPISRSIAVECGADR
jgi:hypothetical protein